MDPKRTFTELQLKEIRDLFDAQTKLTGSVCLEDVAKRIFGKKIVGGYESNQIATLADEWGYVRTKRPRVKSLDPPAIPSVAGKTYFYQQCVVPDWALLLGKRQEVASN